MMNMRPGFTLIEMLVSVAIFTTVMVMALGALLSLSEANRKAELLSSATSNFQSAIDSMTRAMRTGQNYHCGAGTLTLPQSCTSTPSSQFAFLAASNQETVYQLSTTGCPNGLGCIVRSQDGGSTFASITSTEIVVTALNFYVRGSQGSIQPQAMMLMSGYVVIKGSQNSTFNVQTSVTQRLYGQ